MPDGGGGGVDFTVTLINQVTAPANAIKRAMSDVSKSFKATQQQLNAPTPKRGALSDWDKMVSGAKRSQVSDFARQQQKLFRAQALEASKKVNRQKLEAAHSKKIGDIVAQHHADHGLGAMAVEGASSAVVGITAAIAAGAALAAAGIAYLGVQFVEASLEAAKFGERATMAIGFLTNNAPAAAGVFDDIRHQAQALGLDVHDTVDGFQKLLAAQFSIGQSKDLIKMGADMQAIGASAEEVKRIIYAMTEIKSIGTLQKRQERMLQMAGISGELIDQALMKRTGIKTKGGIDMARKKNLIGADVAIGAIQDAVMHKTHESALGDAGTAFADNTLAGMQAKLSGGIENLFIDVGQKILPGVTKLAQLVAGTIGKISDDPQVAMLGQFLLNRFEVFVGWVQTNWPKIETLLIGGLHMTADAIRFVVECLDSSSTTFETAKGLAIGLSVILGLLAVSAFFLMLPFILVGGVIAGLIAVLGMATAWLVDNVPKWYEAGKGLIRGLIEGMLFMMGPLGALIAGVMIATAPPGSDGNTNGVGAALPAATNGGAMAALATVGSDDKTEGGNRGGAGTVHIASMPITVPQSDDPQKQATLIGAAVRAELEKSLHQG